MTEKKRAIFYSAFLFIISLQGKTR